MEASLSEDGALARELPRLGSLDLIVFLVRFDLIGIGNFLTFLYLIAEGHLVRLRPDLNSISHSISSEVYTRRGH
jgi:hypothetical protein